MSGNEPVESHDVEGKCFYVRDLDQELCVSATLYPAADETDEVTIALFVLSEYATSDSFRNIAQRIGDISLGEAVALRRVLDAAIAHAKWLGEEPLPLTVAN